MSQSLMTSRRFAPLFWCQFLSAFNDNVLKNAVVFLILFRVGGAESLVTLAGAALMAPFFLFSAFGGQLADRFDKSLVARRLKLAEIGAAILAVVGFWLQSVPVLFAALLAFGTFGALFGPLKYGILPDHLDREDLPAGNALVEGATFLAILAGTIAGGLAMKDGVHPAILTGGMLIVGVLCWVSSLLIPKTAAASPGLSLDYNVVRSTARLLRELWSEPRLWRCGIITSIFWAVGAVMLSLLAPLVSHVLHGSEIVVTIYLAVFAVAIAVGSGLASWLSGGRVVFLPVVVGTLLIGVASLDLAWAIAHLPPVTPGDLLAPAAFFDQAIAWHTAIDLAIVAIGGGLMIVPSFAALQVWADPAWRARAVAAVNVLNAAFMVVSAVVVAALQGAGVTLPMLFAGIGALALLAAAWIIRILPTNPMHDAISILFRVVYRLETHGLEHLDAAGPNPIIALNHVSFLDAALALSILPTNPIFAIDHGIAQRWWVKPFLRFTRALPLDPARPLATRSLINAVRGGDTLVIFPEGRLTVTGSLMKVYDGAGMIAEKSGAMVVPVRIHGLEQTMFSRLSRAQVRRRWFPKVVVTMLPAVRLTVDDSLKGRARRHAAGAALYGVMSDLIFHTTRTDRTLVEAVAEAGDKQGWSRVALEDPVTGILTYRKLMTGVHLFARKMTALAKPGEAIGVLLPSSNAAAVTLLAVSSAGRVPAMINFTAGATAVTAACTMAGVTSIVTSRAFIEKGRLDKLIASLQASVRIVYLEDLRKDLSLVDKLRALAAPHRPLVARLPDDPAVILFTSGSEGTPKGVVLSHRNMLVNTAQAEARIDFGRSDKFFNVLPVFHSFGLTVGLVLPLVSGVPVYLYPSPLHYRMVPELVYGSNATLLFGTDTFLAGYARVANPYDFRSLRYVLAGAEPVKDATRKVWMEKFGLRILEGYGITEAAPAVALNTPMFNKFGTVGRILPGIDVRLEAVPGIDDGGRLHLRGPNIMLGYLKHDQPGVLQPPEDGWYDTGDIVAIDPEGFTTIKGRAKRFAKIGGEMVSLAAIEALAHDLWPDVPTAVVAEPDPRKGERLVLVTQQSGATRQDFSAYAKRKGAADLMVPSEVVVVERLPVLGSGKVDYVGLAKQMTERAETDAAA
ncbi:acyl-[ACP]--phospholipid O-acyltransferase [Lichenihabitans psoromatis]|uniref:acyl-[ACP]--phospholipid O-acyltransferase n=1 Tax=Lichenihabitans psoromatis TaxID=2528642 RepID=UPI00103833CF|nr:acyl-[ACP]--phospholipid O-acyltransferase [Lichenihabitans psoromatis]